MAVSTDPNDVMFGLESDPTSPNYGLGEEESTPTTEPDTIRSEGQGPEPREDDLLEKMRARFAGTPMAFQPETGATPPMLARPPAIEDLPIGGGMMVANQYVPPEDVPATKAILEGQQNIDFLNRNLLFPASPEFAQMVEETKPRPRQLEPYEAYERFAPGPSVQEEAEQSERFRKEHPYLSGLGSLPGRMIPKSLEELEQFIKLPQSGDPAQQFAESEELGKAWRGEYGPEEQAASIGGTGLQVLPMLHLPFAKSPLRPKLTDLDLVGRMRQAQAEQLKAAVKGPEPAMPAETARVAPAVEPTVDPLQSLTAERNRLVIEELPKTSKGSRGEAAVEARIAEIDKQLRDAMAERQANLEYELKPGEKMVEIGKPETGGEPSASEITEPTSVGVQPEGEGVGRTPPLRQPRETTPVLKLEEEALPSGGGAPEAEAAVAPGVAAGGVGAEVPLGYERFIPDISHLSKLPEKQFDLEHKSASKALDVLEKDFDNNYQDYTGGSQKQHQLAAAQDRYQAVQLERFRREIRNRHPGDLFKDFTDEAARLGDPDTVDIATSEGAAKMKLMLDELKWQQPTDAQLAEGWEHLSGTELSRDPNFREVQGHTANLARKWADKLNEPPPPKPAKPPAPPTVEPEAPVIPPEDLPYAGGEPQTTTPVSEPVPGAPQKPSKIGKSIEAKAVEAKLTQGFAETALYDPITIAHQSQLATDVIRASPVQARAMIRGEIPLPEHLHGISLITAMEEHLLKHPNAQVAYEMANSPLVSATSTAAQELRLAQQRIPDSITAKFAEIKAARAEGAKLRGETAARIAKDINKEVVRTASKRPTWEAFVKEIVC